MTVGCSTDRRTFLAGLAGAATLGAGSTGIASAAGIGPTIGGQAGLPVTEDRRRAVVIGTGFGGAISALRLARAGVPVLMLERGMAREEQRNGIHR